MRSRCWPEARCRRDVALADLGEHRLRDLAQPMRVFQVMHPRLADRFPALGSLDAFPWNLPLQVSSLIGREQEIARTIDALDRARVVTLTGVGGVGKTRLAYQVAAEVLPAISGMARGWWSWRRCAIPTASPTRSRRCSGSRPGRARRSRRRWSSSCAQAVAVGDRQLRAPARGGRGPPRCDRAFVSWRGGARDQPRRPGPGG